jgi:hypothetical protein
MSTSATWRVAGGFQHGGVWRVVAASGDAASLVVSMLQTGRVAAPAHEGLLAASTADGMAQATYSTYSHRAIGMLSAAGSVDLDQANCSLLATTISQLAQHLVCTA